MAFYHDIITEQSFEELKRLQHTIAFTLIGGWAVYLYTKAMKSKDIDIIVSFDQLPVLADHYDLSKNDRLKKYEAVKGPVQIDVYLPHYSKLGLPLEEVQRRTRQLENFTVADPHDLIALKLLTIRERGRTPKGEKDFMDLVALLGSGVTNAETIRQRIAEHNLDAGKQLFLTMLSERRELPELGLNAHRYAKFRKRAEAMLISR